MLTLKLGNGTTITKVDVNGSLLITPDEVTPETFSGGLGRVEITGTLPEGTNAPFTAGTYTNMKLDYFRDAKTHREFVLNPLTEAELRELGLEAKIDYVALMAEVDIDA